MFELKLFKNLFPPRFDARIVDSLLIGKRCKEVKRWKIIQSSLLKYIVSGIKGYKTKQMDEPMSIIVFNAIIILLSLSGCAAVILIYYFTD